MPSSERIAVPTFIAVPLVGMIGYVTGVWVPSSNQLVAASATWLLFQRFVASGFSFPFSKRIGFSSHLPAAGKVVIITGANTGIGLETAVELAKQGASVIVTCRDQAKATATVAAIKSRLSPDGRNAVVHALVMELGSFDSIRRCVEAFHELKLPLHILINNAGAVFPATKKGEWRRTSEGLESTIGCNWVGPVLFTNLLLEKLIQSNGRVINVGSYACQRFKGRSNVLEVMSQYPDFAKLPKGLIGTFNLYMLSKLGNLLHAKSLASQSAGRITAVALHPGWVLSDIWRGVPLIGQDSVLGSIVKFLLYWFVAKSNREGAMTTVACALSPTLVSGGYYTDSRLCTEPAYANDPEVQTQAASLVERSLAAGNTRVA